MKVLRKAQRHIRVSVVNWCDLRLESGDPVTEMTIFVRRGAAETKGGVSAVTVAVSASSPSKRQRTTAMEDVEFDEGCKRFSTPSMSPTVA